MLGDPELKGLHALSLPHLVRQRDHQLLDGPILALEVCVCHTMDRDARIASELKEHPHAGSLVLGAWLGHLPWVQDLTDIMDSGTDDHVAPIDDAENRCAVESMLQLLRSLSDKFVVANQPGGSVQAF